MLQEFEINTKIFFLDVCKTWMNSCLWQGKDVEKVADKVTLRLKRRCWDVMQTAVGQSDGGWGAEGGGLHPTAAPLS